MKRILLVLTVTILVMARLVSGHAVEPGSKDDPVITKSYLETLYAWQITNLQEGQTMSLDLGAQFVMRSGSATVVGVGHEGLIDLTAGRELTDGEHIPLHHLMMSPASDRRGLRTLSQCVLISRGMSR